MKKEFQQLFFTNRTEWREWLKINHNYSVGIFLIYFKKHTGKQSIHYDDAVEEALCFGWIDSIVKRMDDERYMQKFTPRNTRSLWSEINKRRVEKMIELGKMKEAGLIKIKAAKENGKWFEVTDAEKEFVLPEEFLKLISNNTKAKKSFNKQSPSQQKNYIQWIMSAKKTETQKRRFMKMIETLVDPNQSLLIF